MSPRRRSVNPFPPWLVPVCFFLSGAAGLVFEIVWSRYLSLLLGNSIQGVSTVVAAFLGGLGIGAWLGGRHAARTADPLVAYARIELLVGAVGLASPLAYLAARPLFETLYAALNGGGSVFHGLRFLVLFAALLPPTIAMGATLPLLVSHLERRGGSPKSTVAVLYAINTAGAVAGVLCAAFVLVPGLGLWRTAVVAGTVDLAIAVAILLGRRGVAPRASAKRASAMRPSPETIGERESARPLPTRAMPLLIVSCMTLSGLTAILYQIAWVRTLSVPMGGMVYSLAEILALYLLGITAGSMAAARLLRRRHDPVRIFSLFQIGVAATVAAGTWFFARLPEWQASVLIWAGSSARSVLAGNCVIAALIVLAPTFCLGAIFPAAAEIVRERRSEGASSVGMIYAANTVGSIAGSLLTGFMLIPAIGALPAILAAACVNLAIGVVTALAGLRSRGEALAIVTAASVAGVLFGVVARPERDEWKMTLGLARLNRTLRHEGAWTLRSLVSEDSLARATEKVLFYREGAHANVAAVDIEGIRVLVVNGKADASIGRGRDMTTQALLGHLPALALPRSPVGGATRAASVCIVGYGSGVTAHAVLTHPVGRVLTVELERAVIDAAPAFREGAFDPLSDPRSQWIIEDAGLFLRSTPERFDAIVSEPSNPWVSGVGSLYSREFYEASKSHLSPSGVFCQWIQGYEISPEMLGTILRTLAATFPSGHVFYADPSHDYIVLASPRPRMPLDAEALRAAFDRREVAEDLARIDIRGPDDLLRRYRGRLERIAREAGSGPMNTDDNAWVEYRAPIDMLGGGPFAAPLEWDDKVAADLSASIDGPAEESGPMVRAAAERAMEQKDGGASDGLLAALSGRAPESDSADVPRTKQEISQMRERAMEILATALPILSQAAVSGDRAAGERVSVMLAEAHDLDPSNGEIVWRLGTALIVARREATAVAVLRSALPLLPRTQHLSVHRDLAAAHYVLDAPEESLRELDEMERLKPRTAEARYWRARIYLDRGDETRARREIDGGLLDHPGNASLLALRSVVR